MEVNNQEKNNNASKLVKALVFILMFVIFVVCIINIFIPKKTISEFENRKLVTFPKFSLEKLIDGRFTKDLDNYFSDNFILRDRLILLSKKMDYFKSIASLIKNNEDVTIVLPKSGAMMEIINVSTESSVDIEKDDFSKFFQENSNDINEVIECENEYIIYKGIPYVSCGISIKENIDDFVKVLNLYKNYFPNATISSIPVPTSALFLNNTKMRDVSRKMVNDIELVKEKCGKYNNTINVCKTLLEHKDKKVYFDFDHHWTHLGAYYAYTDFCKSIGLSPVPIEMMEKKILNEKWQGSTYRFTYDERFKDGSDEVIAYLPTKENKMYLIDNHTGVILEKDSCITKEKDSYIAFIGGDYPITLINVPDNPQDKNVLVLKDSYGNAFSTFLTEHYGNIVILDPRMVQNNILEYLKGFNFSDIIFIEMLNNISGVDSNNRLKRIIE